MVDARSPLALNIINANPHSYEALVVEGGTPALARELLAGVEPEQLLAESTQLPVAAYVMLAGLWLWHDGLSECHEIVQKSPDDLLTAALNLHSKPSKTSPKVPSVPFVENDKARNPQYLREMASTLAFWHAIMHRREGDFSNSKYWYARCAGHPVMATMTPAAVELVNPTPAQKILVRLVVAGWKPEVFVDLVEQVHGRPADPLHGAAVELQKMEWRLLMEHCVRGAAAP